MSYVHFDQLTPEQQAEAMAVPHRAKWERSEFERFEYWVKPDGHVSRRGGHHQLTREAYEAAMAILGGAVRSKGDLREWKPGVTFHISRD